VQSYEIEIEIDENGEIKAVVKGIKGQSCSDISKFLDELGEVLRDDPTAEFRQQPVAAGNRLKVGGK